MSVAGKWKVTMQTPIGTQQFTWDLQLEQAGWRGTMDSRAGKTDLSDIVVDEDRVSFNSRVDSPMGTIDLAFEGSANGDTISGSCRTLFGNSEFSGVRV
jgi:carbon-monoxide dehydrogenase large subunit